MYSYFVKRLEVTDFYFSYAINATNLILKLSSIISYLFGYRSVHQTTQNNTAKRLRIARSLVNLYNIC